jgi:hypothetical protein
MKRFLSAVLGVTAVLLMASAVPSRAFVTYPNPTCPDSLTIFGLKTHLSGAGACDPQVGVAAGAAGDTILGIGGIITGFDENPTGFDVYIEMSGGGPQAGKYAGLDVFTHGTNMRAPYGLNRGDSIVVEFSRVAIFQGAVEVFSPNSNFSSPNIILRKVNSGNPLPPFVVGNTTDFVETPTNTFFEPYINSLVTLTGPVRVARKEGLNNGTARAMIVVRDAAPSDSVFIDYGKLTAIVPPAVGTFLTSISGISNKASRGYRIMPRDAADIIDVQPPGVSDSYAIADNQYRVVFDRDVTPASATNTANYSLASFGTVNSAVMDGTNAVILTVSGTGLSHGQSETVSVNGVVGTANGVAMTTPGSSLFLAGLMTCGEHSAPNPDSLAASPCRDLSRYVGSPQTGVGSGLTGQFSNGPFGPRSSVTGIVVGVYGNLYYMEDDNPSASRGITVFAPPSALQLGHRYVLAGADEEFYSENEFAAITYVKDIGNPGVPAPVAIPVRIANYDTCDANQNIRSGRDYLSDLVKLQTVKVVQRFPTLPTNGFHVTGPHPDYGDTIFCENQNAVLGPNSSSNPNYPALGSLVNVIGVVHYTTNTSSPSFRVCPRSPADITILDPASVGTPSARLSFSAFPNPASSVNLAFTLPRASNVELGVYDLVGRRVAMIASGPMGAGTYQKVWRGLDDGGNKVRSGVYFYHLRAGNEVLKTHTVLINN